MPRYFPIVDSPRSPPSVQGVITNGGGAAPNIIPEHSEMNYLVRASTGTELNSVRDKVVDCFKGAALSSGCKVDTEIGDLMEELRNDNSLAVSSAEQCLGELSTDGFRMSMPRSWATCTIFPSWSTPMRRWVVVPTLVM